MAGSRSRQWPNVFVTGGRMFSESPAECVGIRSEQAIISVGKLIRWSDSPLLKASRVSLFALVGRLLPRLNEDPSVRNTCRMHWHEYSLP